MTGPRLTEQLSLAFTPVDDEPSPPTTGEGAEPVVTTEAPERPVVLETPPPAGTRACTPPPPAVAAHPRWS